jgi:hypothetical protein
MSDFEFGTAEQLADWIETSLLVSRTGHIGLDALFRLAEEELGKEQVVVTPALSVMTHRQVVLGELYPFEVVPGIAVVTRHTPLRHCYVALLQITPDSIARQTVRAEPSDIAKMGILLEELAEVALSNFWGPGGEALAFGYPSRRGRPASFDQALVWLASQMKIKIGQGYRDPRRQDGGVDIVAWRRFLDNRQGFPIALAQCTIQRETFTKTTDIDLRLWSSWLALDADPLSLLIVPGTIREAGTEWGQLSTVVMVIERLRLIELISRGELPGDYVTLWADEVLVALREVVRAAEL